MSPTERSVALRSLLVRLDHLLERAVNRAEASFQRAPGSDPFRGLYVGGQDVRAFLQRPPGLPMFGELAPEDGEPGALAALLPGLELDDFELNVVLIGLGCEIDLRYERIYAYLQDDVTRRRPTVDLVLSLLCASPEEKIARRASFAPDAPLVRDGIVSLLPDPAQAHPSLLSSFCVVDERVVRIALGEESVDSRLAPYARVVRWGRAPALGAGALAAARVVERARAKRAHAVVYVRGGPSSSERDVALAIASHAEADVLSIDVSALGEQLTASLASLVRHEAQRREAALMVSGLDALPDDGWARRALLEEIARFPGVAILCGTRPWQPVAGIPLGVMTVEPHALPVPARRALWSATLSSLGVRARDEDLDVAASRYRLGPTQIDDACRLVRTAISGRRSASLDDLATAARAQSGHHMMDLARKIEPRRTWDDIVLPDDTVLQLRELCDRVVFGERVRSEWGFDEKLSAGRGTVALFSGPSGTGKTMAAEIIAAELALDLYVIKIANVVSKYIGETEKNLERVFEAADGVNGVLLFDEADALFGKRSEVRDSHDRYANLEISYLLQKMEEFDGVAILATNLRQNLDDSFTRRLASHVHFPFPDAAQRGRIWRGIWPERIPLDERLDFDGLASEFRLSGGNIKNAALAAAYFAASDGGRVEMHHLLAGVRREYEKLGRALDDDELRVEPLAVTA